MTLRYTIFLITVDTIIDIDDVQQSVSTLLLKKIVWSCCFTILSHMSIVAFCHDLTRSQLLEFQNVKNDQLLDSD